MAWCGPASPTARSLRRLLTTLQAAHTLLLWSEHPERPTCTRSPSIVTSLPG
ncbi:hypothetical protein ACIRJO_37960 [Streptomyces sp. NPDC102394]|uniref:hypothetical protein n=1 Tax=Streptomyces sp. NPDC102394 TaxID=3366167 RepID=UPI003822389C